MMIINDVKVVLAYPPLPPPSQASLCEYFAPPSASEPLSSPPPTGHNHISLLFIGCDAKMIVFGVVHEGQDGCYTETEH